MFRRQGRDGFPHPSRYGAGQSQICLILKQVWKVRNGRCRRGDWMKFPLHPGEFFLDGYAIRKVERRVAPPPSLSRRQDPRPRTGPGPHHQDVTAWMEKIELPRRIVEDRTEGDIS
jgi:hypothetical protein